MGKQSDLLITLFKTGWSDDMIDEILRHMPNTRNYDWKRDEEAAGQILEIVLESTTAEECLAGLEAM